MKRASLAGMLVLSACSPAEPPIASNASADEAVVISVPGPDRVVAAGALPTPELDGIATSAGRWRRDAGPGGDTALFSDARGRIVFALRCDRERSRVLFVRAAPAGVGGMLKIVTDTGAASYPAQPRRFAPGAVAVALLSDGFVATSLARATGRIGVTLAGSPTLVMPVDKAIAAVIGGCAGLSVVG